MSRGKNMEETKTDKGDIKMTHPEEIMRYVATLVDKDGNGIFRRVDIRDRAGLTAHIWDNGYNPIFQSMRSDQPGGAPGVAEKFRGVFRWYDPNIRGDFVLTDYGKQLVYEFRHT